MWFDQSELRGGDEWDAKIRGQIKTCTLFVPVISQTTQARDQAYFRGEWKLGKIALKNMAPGKAFIGPVVIDICLTTALEFPIPSQGAVDASAQRGTVHRFHRADQTPDTIRAAKT